MSIGVCIEPFWAEHGYLDRIRRVAELGFTHYEFWFPDKRFDGSRLHDEPKDFEAIGELNERHGLTTTDFVLNHPAGGIVASLIDPRDRSRLVDGFGRVAELARKIHCRSLISASGDRIPGVTSAQAVECMTGTLRALAPLAETEGITILVEPFNSRVDHPDCFLDDPELCVQVLRDVGCPNVAMLYDIYHMQIMGGSILAFVRANLAHIRHFHIAGVPGRHEPWPCELDYRHIVSEIRAMGYRGAFGLEYWPTAESDRSLRETLASIEGNHR